MQMFPESSSLQEGCWIIKAPGTKQLQRGRDEVCVSEKSFHCILSAGEIMPGQYRQSPKLWVRLTAGDRGALFHLSVGFAGAGLGLNYAGYGVHGLTKWLIWQKCLWKVCG